MVPPNCTCIAFKFSSAVLWITNGLQIAMALATATGCHRMAEHEMAEHEMDKVLNNQRQGNGNSTQRQQICNNTYSTDVVAIKKALRYKLNKNERCGEVAFHGGVQCIKCGPRNIFTDVGLSEARRHRNRQ